MSDATHSLVLLNAVAGLATRLSVDGLAVYSVRYDYLAFGSWELIAGRRLAHVRIVWNAKDGRLEVESARLAKAADAPRWQSVRSVDFSKKRGNTLEIFAAAHAAIREHAGAA